MCCVCNLLCKIISMIISLLFIVAVVLLLLWGLGIIFQKDDATSTSSLNTSYLNNNKMHAYSQG